MTQVALAIEEKRTAHAIRRKPSSIQVEKLPLVSIQGRAFAAPRMQSLDQMRARAQDLQEIGKVLDQSPRKHDIRRAASARDYHSPSTKRRGRIFGEREVAGLQDRLSRFCSDESIGSRPLFLQARPVTTPRRDASSALGFRDPVGYNDRELSILDPFMKDTLSRSVEGSRECPHHFGKKASLERWKNVVMGVSIGRLKKEDAPTNNNHES